MIPAFWLKNNEINGFLTGQKGRKADILATDEGFYYVCSGDMKEGGYYIGTISNENWEQAVEIFENTGFLVEKQRN